MEWTTEKPTEAGWYWTRGRGGAIACVLVTTIKDDDDALFVGVPCFADPFPLDYFDVWMGPLPVPELPK